MEAFQQWSEGTRSTVVRAGAAGFGALILILLFAIYVRFFPTPVSYLFQAEGFTQAIGTGLSLNGRFIGREGFSSAATMEKPATGTSRQQRLTK